jgi:Uma2 family endonuclease
LTPVEYLAFERAQTDAKHEYLNGEIMMMAGASLEHNRIVSNLVAALHAQMHGRSCDVFSSDMRVHISATGLYTYPDIAALCGVPQLEDDESDTLLNPEVIIEVLSPSIEAYDRGSKFDHYRSLESLQTYVLVAQDRWQIELYQRQDS